MKWAVAALSGMLLAGFVYRAASPAGPALAASPSAESLLGLFPEDTDGVFFVDVVGLRDHPLFRDLADGVADRHLPAPLQDFADATGLDIRRDVEHVMIGSVRDGGGLTIAQANYDRPTVEEYFAGRGVEPETYRGYALYQPKPDEDWKVAFLDSYVALGSDGLLRGLLDRATEAQASALDNASLVENIRSIEDGSQIWAAGVFAPSLLPDGMAPPMATDLIGALRQGAYQMHFDAAVTTRAIGAFDTSASAERTADLLRGLVTLGRIQASSQSPDLVELLDGVHIQNIDAEVRIDSVADTELLRRLAANGISVR